MSGAGRAAVTPLDASQVRVAVVAAEWHEEVMACLISGARRALDDANVKSVTVVRVPGSFELPIVAQALAMQSFDAVVALGVVIRGSTPHFDYVCTAVTNGLTRVALDTSVPVGFGVLTCDDEQQARDRAGVNGADEDKGYDAAHAALKTALTLANLRQA